MKLSEPLVFAALFFLSQASAATSARCLEGSFCLYEHRDYEGRRLPAYNRVGVLRRGDWDTLSSAVNKTGSTLCLYNAGNGNGNYYLVATVAPHRAMPYISGKDNGMVATRLPTYSHRCESIINDRQSSRRTARHRHPLLGQIVYNIHR